MKRIWLLHVIIVGIILFCAFSPWLFLAMVTLTNAESLEGLALGAGYLGVGLTPLGLLVAGIYVIAAVIYHIIATWKGRTKPVSVGKYLLVWLGVMVVGGIIGWVLLTVPQSARKSDEQTVQGDCDSLVDEPTKSDLSSGTLAMGWRFLDSVSSIKKDGFMVLGPEMILEQNLELEHQVYGLDWSPDGKEVVFSDGSNLYIMDADGGNLHEVPLPDTGEGRRLEIPDWSPDGKLIYFSWQIAGGTTPDLEIFAVQPDGNGLIQLTDAEGSSFDPTLSPDGNQIAFVSNRNGEDKLYLMKKDGSDQQVLPGDTAHASSPAWSPNGRWIVFLSDQTSDWSLHITAVDGSGSCLLISPEREISSPAWSPDGSWIYYIQGAGSLMAVSPNSEETRFVYLNSSFTVLNSPAWKPEGH